VIELQAWIWSVVDGRAYWIFQMKFLVAVLLCISLALLSVTTDAADVPGPSFDCSKASRRVETVICGADELRSYDWWLTAVYGDALEAAREHAEALEKEQGRWLKLRDRSCGLDGAPMQASHGSQVGCLMRLYIERVSVIAAKSIDPIWQAAAANPEGALDRLRRLQSPLAHRYADMLTHARSDEPIAAFVSFAESDLGPAWQISPFTGEIHIPCALIERYPRLMLISRPFNGSSADALLPDIDCGDAAYQDYPKPVGAFLKNNPMTLQNWFNRCVDGGTIVHAYARDLWLRGLRLAQFPRSYLSDRITWLVEPEKPWPSVEEVAADRWAQHSDFKKAEAALVDRYRRRFGLSQRNAQTAAERALYDNRIGLENPDGGCDP